jgi:hypothetical protein
MLTPEDHLLWDQFFRETDPVERLFLMVEIKERGMDVLEYFHEYCAFCGEWKPMRLMRQVSVFEKHISARQQDRWQGQLVFRCNSCKEKKQRHIERLHDLEKQRLSCIGENGFIDDFSKWEFCDDLIETERMIMRKYDTTIDGLWLSSLDNVVDLMVPGANYEFIRRRIVNEGIEEFLKQDKRAAFLKWM